MSERRQSASNRCMQRATHQIGHLIIFFASFFYSWFVSGVVSFLLLCFAFESCRDAVNITHVSCTAVFLQSCAAFKLRSFFLFTFQIVLFQYSYSYLLFTFCMKDSINLSGWCMNLNLLIWIGRNEKENEWAREREKWKKSWKCAALLSAFHARTHWRDTVLVFKQKYLSIVWRIAHNSFASVALTVQ